MTAENTLEQILSEAGDWISAESALRRFGLGDNARTEEIERFYAQLRDLDLMGRLEVRPVNDTEGRKIYDHLRLKEA